MRFQCLSKNSIKNIFLLGFILVTATACSTLNKSECLTADWKTIGYEDGTKGYKASRISQHRSACAEYGIRPDLNAYTAGRKEGLHHYCIPTTAYKKGLYGYSYNGVCAGYNEKVFLGAYYDGIEVYKEKNILNKMKSDYSKEESYISSLELELHEKEHILVNGHLTKVKALTLLNETKDIAEELGKTKVNLELLADDISKQSQHVHYLTNQNAYR